MMPGQSTCDIHSGSGPKFSAPGTARIPSRTSRTVRREHRNARAISRRLRPSASRRRISSYRCTVKLRSAMLPSPSWWPTKAAAARPGLPPTAAQMRKLDVLRSAQYKATAYEAPRATIAEYPGCQLPPENGSMQHNPASAEPPEHAHRAHRKAPQVVPSEEIGWSRTQEIRWSPSQEIAWVPSEEILQVAVRRGRF